MQDWEKAWEQFLAQPRVPEHNNLIEQKVLLWENYWGEGQVPGTIFERYRSGEVKDFILENLQTHDWRLLVKALETEFGDQVRFQKTSGNSDKEYLAFQLVGTRDLPVSDIIESFRAGKGKDLCNFYGYTVSQLLGNSLQLEPEFPEKAEDFIYGDCYGICYHLAPKRYLESIIENGLRCRGRDSDRRSYPKRIYVFATPPGSNYAVRVREGLEQLAALLGGNLEDFQPLRIRLGNGNMSTWLPFYRDTASFEGCFFTYTNIPASWLKPVDV